MKLNVVALEDKEFKPVKFELTIETLEEFKEFHQVIGRTSGSKLDALYEKLEEMNEETRNGQ